MLKKIATLVCLGGTALSTTVFSDNASDGNESGIYSGGFTIGTSLDTSLGITTPFLTLGYINECFLADVGFSYTNLSFDSDKENYAFFMAHVGLRNELYQNLYVTYGVTGSASAGNGSDSGDPWSAGAFLGMDLQITRHFLLSTKINPYNFARPGGSFKFNELFASGSINLAYVF